MPKWAQNVPNNVKTLAIKGGDLNLLSEEQLGNALSSDVFIVFGASYIKGWLVDFLVLFRHYTRLKI